jgi:hypothetical protein
MFAVPTGQMQGFDLTSQLATKASKSCRARLAAIPQESTHPARRIWMFLARISVEPLVARTLLELDRPAAVACVPLPIRLIDK